MSFDFKHILLGDLKSDKTYVLFLSTGPVAINVFSLSNNRSFIDNGDLVKIKKVGEIDSQGNYYITIEKVDTKVTNNLPIGKYGDDWCLKYAV